MSAVPAAVQQAMQRPPGTPPSAQGHSIPAPIGGLNAKDALANMPETDAVIIDNFFVQPTWVEVRNGCSNIATFTGTAETVAAYNGFAASQLYAAVVNGTTRSIFRVDGLAGGPVGAPVVGGAGNVVQPVTSTQYDWVQFSSGSTSILGLVNGADPALVYNGSAWSVWGLTGIATNLLSCAAVYHQRLWFAQANSFTVWYLPQTAISGALTSLDLGNLFQLGGSLQSILSISIDNSQGTNDYIAFISTQGEVIVYTGYDPSQVATWYLSAHFRIGAPIGIGRRMWQKIGSDAAVLCADGLVMLSEELLTDRTQQAGNVSAKIRKAIQAAIQSFGGNFGWQVQLDPLGTKLLLTVPTTPDAASYMFVMNLLNQAWSTFGLLASSWNAYCMEISGDSLYVGTNGAVMLADSGGSDNGNAINYYVRAAYSNMGMPGRQKLYGMCRPIFVANGSTQVGISLSVDFVNALFTGTIGTSQGNSAKWNTALWTTPTYWGDALVVSKNWIGLSGLGYTAALQIQGQSLNVSLQWQSTDFLFQPAGLVG
jgi:hypothetical protein